MNHRESELKAILADIENESIDKRDWMPKRDQVLTEARKGHGDVESRNGRYFCSTIFAFDELYIKPVGDPVLNSAHLSSAEFFVTLNDVANRGVGYAKLKFIMSELHGMNEKIPGFCAQTLGKLIAMNMEKWQYSRCERLCLQPLKSNDWAWIIEHKESTRKSFDALGKAIEIAIDILKQRIDNNFNYEGRTAPKIIGQQ